MSIRNFILNRFSKVDRGSVRNSSRRVPVRRISSNSKWKPVIQVEVRHNILEGTHEINLIPYEPPFQRKHKSIR
jgi:hypothetical protein